MDSPAAGDVTFSHVIRDAHGHPEWLVYTDGTKLRPIAGGSEPPPEPPPAPAPSQPPAPPTPPPAGYVPQETVNSTVLRETEKAKTAALQSLADEWGVSLDEAKQIVADHKAGEAAKLTEAEKRERAAAEAEQKAKDREAAATVKERDATVRAALAEAGCGKDDMTDARRLVDIPDGDLDDKTVTTAVEDLKKRRPELFGGTKPAPPAGFVPPGSPTPGAQPSTMAERREHYRKQREAQSA